MTTPFRFGSAISLVALATAISGCAAPHGRTATLSIGGKASAEVGLATKALMALNANDPATAITYAEQAVQAKADDFTMRALLGNAYFAAGRFASAEAAYKDSLTLFSNQPHVVLKLALAEIAQGKSGEAVSYLDAARNVDAAAIAREVHTLYPDYYVLVRDESDIARCIDQSEPSSELRVKPGNTAKKPA